MTELGRERNTELPFPAGVEDPDDLIDVEASPSAWLSSRALLIVGVVVGAALVISVVVALVYWISPPMHAITVPLVPKA